MEWTEMSTAQPQGHVPIQEEEATHIGGEAVGLEPGAIAVEPGPVAAVPVEPRYPAHDRRTPEQFSMNMQSPQKKGRGNDVP